MNLPKFEKAEELNDFSEIREGAWLQIESTNYGLPSSMIAYVRTAGRPYCQVLISNKDQFTATRVAFQDNFSSRLDYAQHGYKFRVWRTKQQPELTQDILLKNLVIAQDNSSIYTGTDPEVFIEDAAGNILPAYEFLPKKSKDVSVFWDGFQAEFTPWPSTCQDTAGHFIDLKLNLLASMLPPGARFSTKSVVEIPKSLLRSAKFEHVDFGCRPSLNAYGLTGEVIPDAREMPLRFAGGHIHWGIAPQDRPKDWPARVVEAVKFVDAIAGLMGVSMSEGLDDPRRRRFYGLAGEYRLPAHGIEYRVLSNFWLFHPSIYQLLFTMGRMALKMGLAGNRTKLLRIPESAVVNAINNQDVELARTLIRKSEDLFLKMLEFHFGSYAPATFQKILSPVTSWGINLKAPIFNWANRDCVYVMRWSWFISHSMNPTIGAKDDPDYRTTKSGAVSDVPGNAVAAQPPQSESR